MRIPEGKRVTLETARFRALAYLADQHQLTLSKASSVGAAIWEGCSLRAQGLGGSAARILRGLQKDGLVKWASNDHDWGWLITSSGRRYIL